MSLTGLIRIVPEEGKKGTTKGKKIFFGDPTIYAAYEGNLGNVRESFVAMSFDLIHKKVLCPKDDSISDFIVDDMLIEVGGRNKKTKASDLLIRDNLDVPVKGIIPLWLLGFLME